ncbi:hypothetical protein C2G38_2102247 [Gigaspora rosea]|uniref:Uncharacterized protein n=1 Tax=Gigaspora rosea TaxID=44941 RepID=A0A397UXH1_9GLOM|nr:hypothetical protein C2G38_2102247 [Gigaspora rosea]
MLYIAAILFDGLTIVISPLTALMKNQVVSNYNLILIHIITLTITSPNTLSHGIKNNIINYQTIIKYQSSHYMTGCLVK